MKATYTVHCPACDSDFKTSKVSLKKGLFTVQCPDCTIFLDMDITKEEDFSKVASQEDNENKCPKCNTEVSDQSESCSKCGLIFKKWKGNTKPFKNHKILKKKWSKLKKIDLEDPLHFIFLEECFNHNVLDDAASAYIALGAKKNLDVSQKLRQLQILAQMSVAKPKKSDKESKRFNWSLIIATMIFLGICWYIWSITPQDLLG
jgi:hypothetical protein